LGFDLEAIEIRVYDDCVYISYPLFEYGDEEEKDELCQALANMPLPRNFEFDRNGKLLEYRVDAVDRGFLCDLGWLSQQFQKIINYATTLTEKGR